jgi:NTE family protein
MSHNALPGRALVLGGGGVTGVAWEIGVLAGLAACGVDLTDADLVVGTSAGSVVGVDVRSGRSLAESYDRQLAPPTGEIAAKMGRAVLVRYLLVITLSRDPARAGRRFGALALRAKTMPESSRRKVIESRLPVFEWPHGPLKITAVDAASGEFTVFDATSGVGLVDAVGASCAVPGVWPPVSIGDRRYIDGGMRSAANAHLAAGYRRVVILAPLTRGFGPMASVPSQARDLVAGGSQVVTIEPDDAALKAIGKNVLDPARRAAAARAGYAQAEPVAATVRAVWHDGTEAAGAR